MMLGNRFSRIATVVAMVPLLIAACAPSQSSSSGGGAPSQPAPSTPKNIVMINSGNPPGMDNRFVVTSNNAARIVLGLYSAPLINSDALGNKLPVLVEAVPSVDNGAWKLNSDNTM